MLMLASIDRLEEAEELVMIRQPGVDGARVVVFAPRKYSARPEKLGAPRSKIAAWSQSTIS